MPFDVAIIDLVLPKLSGMDLVKQLREAGQRCPILILTARSSWQDKVLGLKNGADDDYRAKLGAYYGDRDERGD